ncbi:TMV resistance protein N [Eucalyptus grandis]|uniref:TMV resistance protein N n=1 Tax=Eucalyptus grandis TaxID=71139 RepID=UPI00192EAED4|nr:TMV resistance protein N [Eucalyptus grandis]
MESTPFVLALAFCFIAFTSRSPTQPVIFVATIALAVIVSASTRKRIKPGLVSSPPPSPPSPSPSPSSSSSPNSSSTSSRTDYDVFLSFRGPDTRKGFIDFLYHKLRDAGINVFRDDNDLRPGEKIDDALIESIKQSKMSIPIISEGYASSRSCLMELAQMLDCQKANNQWIMPIFYDIDLAELKHPRECVFRKHEKRGVNHNDIAKWRQALQDIAKTKGYDLRNTKNGHQAELIEKVVSDVLQVLKTNDLVVTDELVGIEFHAREVMRKLGIIYVNEQAMEICGKDVHVLGICGMPGVGKTTLANWFGPRSRIIMTVRRKDVLKNYPFKVADEYQVEPMEYPEALLLFQKRAFVEDPLEEQCEYGSLSRDIVHIIKGLPLAIEITASYLREKRGQIDIWVETLRKLESKPEDGVKIAFKYFPSTGVDRLCDLCLVKIGENHELRMHSQLREFGREIVMMEHKWPWKRSRIWNHTDALSALKRKESAENVEALALPFDEGQSECFRCEGFGHYWSLRFLRLEYATIGGSSQDALSNLRWLDWQACSKISELLILDLKNLAILDLSRSSVTENAQEWGQILEIHFRETASTKQLQILSARQCKSLAHISASIGQLESLTYLGLDGAAIDSLPDSIGSLKKLQSLLLGNCQKLPELPYSIGKLELLEVMDLSSTVIARLPRSVKNLKELKVLKMENTRLREFPRDIKDLEKLEEINLSRCKHLKGPIRCDIKGLSSLKVLRLSSTKTSGLPWSDGRFSDRQTLSLLSHLQRLDLSECDQIRVLPTLPSNLSSLRWGSKKMRTVPNLCYLKYLRELYLGDITDPRQKSSSKPPEIGWVTSLEYLEILELRLSKVTLPENFSALQLRKLVLHYADSLDLRGLPSSLSTLCLQHCKIQVPQFSETVPVAASSPPLFTAISPHLIRGRAFVFWVKGYSIVDGGHGVESRKQPLRETGGNTASSYPFPADADQLFLP